MPLHAPVVTFVVPCYRLAGFLGDCVESILAQSFDDFEILIMDDCSPDDTPRVAASFTDPRVRCIRNPTNLGHLENYNEGIRLARGRYLWLISADDRLRSRGVLATFVAALDCDPDVTFAFCPAMSLEGAREAGVVPFCWVPPAVTVLEGRDLLRRLLRNNMIAAPAVLARKSCYLGAGLFPLDLPFAGDWYFWCRFALEGRVACFPEPMVYYRQHPGSMTQELSRSRIRQIVSDEITVRWRIRRDAQAMGRYDVARLAADCVIGDYAGRLAMFDERHPRGLSLEDITESLNSHASSAHEAAWFLRQILETAADNLYARGHAAAARRGYDDLLRRHPAALRVLAKRLLLQMGTIGARLRARASALGPQLG